MCTAYSSMQQPPWTSTQSGLWTSNNHKLPNSRMTRPFRSLSRRWIASFHYGRGDVNTDAALILHESTQGELKERNSHGGANDRSMSRLLLIVIYQFWEDHYREGFAKAVGVDKNAIVSDIFGDIRRIRNDISTIRIPLRSTAQSANFSSSLSRAMKLISVPTKQSS